MAPPAKPTATGIRPIRIDVPRAGQAFNFTKVLNVGREPPTVSVSVMRMKVFRAWQSAVHASAFLLGLVLLWRLARRPERSSFWMAVAVVLVVASLASHLIAWRLLHLGLIAAVPALPLALIAWAVWRWRQRRKAARPPAPPPAPPADSGAAPAAATALLALFAVAGSACSAFASQTTDHASRITDHASRRRTSSRSRSSGCHSPTLSR
jgi:hypothetical protein